MLTFVGLAWPGSKCYIIKQVVMSFHIIGPGQARPEISTCPASDKHQSHKFCYSSLMDITSSLVLSRSDGTIILNLGDLLLSDCKNTVDS